jgi:tRNA threonylcarbamoyladenosine biosynthesis protein TsaE
MLKIKSLETIHKSAQDFIYEIGDKKVFAFNGKMGAGKTTFIKAICEVLGVKENISSPTFSIVNEYETENGQHIYHFDCYRINNVQEAIDFGAEEYLYSGNLCFIEWAENIAPLLPDSIINVDIEEIENNERRINFPNLKNNL